jgi:hypothetical protein
MVGAGETSSEWRRLGLLLREHGVVKEEEVERALAHQHCSGERLGEILLGWGFVSGPLLTRVLAEQRGVRLEEETGFGTGLRAEIERRHRERSSLRLRTAAMPAVASSTGGQQDV